MVNKYENTSVSLKVSRVEAEIITIGDEILIGQIVDTNSAFIASLLNMTGIVVKQITSVSDEKNHINRIYETGVFHGETKKPKKFDFYSRNFDNNLGRFISNF